MRRARAEPSKTCRAGDARGGRWPRGRRRREHCCEVRSSRQADRVRAPSIGTRGVGTRQTTVMGSPTTHACYGQVPGWLGVRAGLEKDKCATRAPLATTVVHSSSQQRTGPRYRHTCLAHCRHQRSGGGGDTIGCV